MGLFSLILLAAGAVLSFAVADNVEGVDLTLIGYIMMGVGVIGLFAALIRSSSEQHTRTERRVTDDGAVVEEHHSTRT